MRKFTYIFSLCEYKVYVTLFFVKIVTVFYAVFLSKKNLLYFTSVNDVLVSLVKCYNANNDIFPLKKMNTEKV